MKKKFNFEYLVIPFPILGNKELKDSDKMTLSLIYSFHNNGQTFYMSNEKMGERLGVSTTAASERITKLEKLGYIMTQRTKLGSKERRIVIPLRMIPPVGTPNPPVGTPIDTSRYTEYTPVGGVGSIT
jgi:biotin operon repressor